MASLPKRDTAEDFYQLLNLGPDATASELEGRIRSQLAQARRLVGHPKQGAKATLLIQQLRTARQVLLDPRRRAQYDLQRRRQQQPLPAVAWLVERWSRFAPYSWRFNLRHRRQAAAGRYRSLGLLLGSLVGRLTGRT